MPRRVLDETCLVAERVAAVLTHAVEVGLVFSVAAMGVPAVFVESEPEMELIPIVRLCILGIFFYR